MWKLIPVLACLLAGCVSSARQPFKLREKVALVSNASVEVHIYQAVSGYGYWVPVQDVTRTVLERFVVESEIRDKATGAVHHSHTPNLVPSTSGEHTGFPGFLGASIEAGFWTSPRGFFAVNFSDGSVREHTCDSRFLIVGKWEQAGERSVRRINEHGVFEFTPEGARQVAGAP